MHVAIVERGLYGTDVRTGLLYGKNIVDVSVSFKLPIQSLHRDSVVCGWNYNLMNASLIGAIKNY